MPLLRQMRPWQPLLGITGGVATGKSTAAGMFEELGAVVLSADRIAREVLSPPSQILHRVLRAFGKDVRLPDGTLDRARLAERVFSDPDARKRLERLTHPEIRTRLRSRIESARKSLPGRAIIVVEVPLLYEARMDSWFEKVLVVGANEETQVARAAARSGLTEDQARQRVAAQMPIEEKAARADYAIWNEGSLEELKCGVCAVWCEITKEDSCAIL